MAPIVGRESELAGIEAFLAEADRGARALVLVGEAGIGKTTLWQEAVGSRARARRAPAGGTPAESEAQLSFGALADFLGQSARALRGPAGAAAAALDVALLRVEAERPPERRRRHGVPLDPSALAADRPSCSRSTISTGSTLRRSAVDFATRRWRAPVRVIVSIRAEWAELLGPRARPRACAGSTSGRCRLPRFTASSPTCPDGRFRAHARAHRAGLGWQSALRARDRAGGSTDAQRRPFRFPTSLQDARRPTASRSLPARTRVALLRTSQPSRGPTGCLVDADALAAAEEAGLVRIEPDGRIDFAHPLFASAVYTSAPRDAGVRRTVALVEAVGSRGASTASCARREGPDDAARGASGCGRLRTARRTRHRGGADGARLALGPESPARRSSGWNWRSISTSRATSSAPALLVS